MDAKEVAKSVMKVTSTSQTDVAKKAGLTGQSNVSMYLQSKSMRVEALTTILNACGYELVARDPNGKLPDFVVGQELSPAKGADTDIAATVRAIVAEELAKLAGGKKE